MKKRCLLTIALMIVFGVVAQAQTFTGAINPQFAFGGGYNFVYQAIHADLRSSTTPAIGQIEFRDPNGALLAVPTQELGTASQFNVTLPPERALTLTLLSNGPDIKVGSVRFISTNGVMVGTVARYSSGPATVGVPNSDTFSTGYVPLTLGAGFSAGIAIANASTTAPVNVRFDEILPAGATAQQGSTLTIPANGQVARIVGPELGLNNALATNSVLKVTVVGTGSVAATPLLLGNGYISSSTVFTAGAVEEPIYLPHIAIGGDYTSQVDSMNLSSLNLRARLSLYDQNGGSMQAQLTASGGGGAVGPSTTSTLTTGPVAAGGRVHWDISTTSGLRVGWAKVEWFDASSGSEVPYPNPASGIIRNGLIHVGEQGTRPHYAVVIPINVSNSINTGFALAFPGKRAATLTMRLVDGNGTTYNLSNFPTQRTSLSQVAAYVTQTFGSVPNLNGAYLSIRSDGAGGPFLPFAILDSNGTFSSTAVTRALAYPSNGFVGTFSGTWNNTTFGSSGPMTMVTTIPAGSTTANMQMTLGGNVFGGAAPSPESWTCTLSVDGCTATFNSPTFGPATFRLTSDGNLFFSGRPLGGAFRMTGSLSTTRGQGDYSVSFPGTAAVGTFLINKP